MAAVATLPVATRTKLSRNGVSVDESDVPVVGAAAGPVAPPPVVVLVSVASLGSTVLRALLLLVLLVAVSLPDSLVPVAVALFAPAAVSLTTLVPVEVLVALEELAAAKT